MIGTRLTGRSSSVVIGDRMVDDGGDSPSRHVDLLD
jgi:hypothetical protein